MGVGAPSSSEDECVRLYVKAGVDGERLGACPFCQRVHMVMTVKAMHGLLKFKMIVTNPSKPPEELKQLGLKHLPAIVHGEEGFDVEDDIVEYLDRRFPGGGLKYNNPEADIACKDFFSKFCFYIKTVNQDSAKLDHALEKLNNFLEALTPPPSLSSSSPTPASPSLTTKSLSSFSSTVSSPTPSLMSSQSTSPLPSPGPSSPKPCKSSAKGESLLMSAAAGTHWPVAVGTRSPAAHSGSNGSIGNDSGAASLNSEHSEQWLCGPSLTHLDCEVLPKLQHLRVAAATLKQYQVPRHLRGCWRYLHTAYCNAVFVQTCPCDQEIVLHWHDRPETKKLTHKKHAEIAKEKPKYSFDVPVHASVVTVVAVD